jgi:hypothetical protein
LVFGCKLHNGFLNSWGDVKQQTIIAVKAARATNPSYTVIITGHSLGGAIATVSGAYLRVAGIPCDINTYGSPRVGNSNFVNFVNSQAGAHYRVTHNFDPVSRYPSRLFGYSHSSTEFWLSTSSATTTSYDVADIKVCVGIESMDSNGSNLKLGLTPHSYYFQKVSECK